MLPNALLTNATTEANKMQPLAADDHCAAPWQSGTAWERSARFPMRSFDTGL